LRERARMFGRIAEEYGLLADLLRKTRTVLSLSHDAAVSTGITGAWKQIEQAKGKLIEAELLDPLADAPRPPKPRNRR